MQGSTGSPNIHVIFVVKLQWTFDFGDRPNKEMNGNLCLANIMQLTMQ